MGTLMASARSAVGYGGLEYSSFWESSLTVTMDGDAQLETKHF
jgi:hypothetical protein